MKRRIVILATAALLALLILAPAAMAQSTMSTSSGMESTGPLKDTSGGLPTSGGPAILLPAAALLLGSGILTFAVLRRR
jgi:hypothetical protein